MCSMRVTRFVTLLYIFAAIMLHPVAIGAQGTCPAFQSPSWSELVNFRPSKTVQQAAVANGWHFQGIEQGSSDLVNLDYFAIDIAQTPKIHGTRLNPSQFLDFVRTHLDWFIDHTKASFRTKSPNDLSAWQQGLLGTQLQFSIIIPLIPNRPRIARVAEVILSDRTNSRWVFSTGHDDRTPNHPVSGNREFGVEMLPNGHVVFYTRGADRISNALDAINQDLIFSGGEDLWTAFQDRMVALVNSHDGNASPITPQVNRPCWSTIKGNIFNPSTTWSALTPPAAEVSSLQMQLWKQQFEEAVAAHPEILVKEWSSRMGRSPASIARLDTDAEAIPDSAPLDDLVLQLKKRNPDLTDLAPGTGLRLVASSEAQLNIYAEATYRQLADHPDLSSPIAVFARAPSSNLPPVSSTLPQLLALLPASPIVSGLNNALQALPAQQLAAALRSTDQFKQVVSGAFQSPQALVDQINTQVTSVQQLSSKIFEAVKAPDLHQKFDTYENSVLTVSTDVRTGAALVGLFDNTLAHQIATTSDSLLTVSSTAATIADGISDITKNGLSNLATGNIVGAVANLVSLFGGQKPDPAVERHKEIMAALTTINSQLVDIKAQLNVIDHKLDHLQSALDQISFTMTTDIAMVEHDITDLKNAVLRSEVERHQEFLDTIEIAYNEKLTECAVQFKHRTFLLTNDDSTNATLYRGCLGAAVSYAVNTSRAPSFNGTTTTIDTDLVNRLSQQPPEAYIGLLSVLLRLRVTDFNSLTPTNRILWYGIADMPDLPAASNTVPNPLVWARGVKDYLEMRQWAPEFDDRSDSLSKLKSAGKDILVFLDYVRDNHWDVLSYNSYRSRLGSLSGQLHTTLPAFRKYASQKGYTLEAQQHVWALQTIDIFDDIDHIYDLR